MASNNPFIEDVERQHTRRPRSWFFEGFFPLFCTAVIGIAGFIVFIYAMAYLNPLELDNADPIGKDPNSVNRSIRRWPAPIFTNSSMANPLDSNDPYDVSRPIRRRPTSIMPNSTIATTQPANLSTIGSMGTPTTESSIRSFPNATYEATTQAKITETYFQPFNESDLNSIVYPDIPPFTMCVPAKMGLTEFEDKRWYCERCWKEAGNETLTTFAKSEEQHRFNCHRLCFENYDFQTCALHLFNTAASESARECRYCKETREALLGDHQ